MLTKKVSRYLSSALAAGILTTATAHAELVAYWNFDADYTATVGSPTYDATPFDGESISDVESKWGGGAAHFDKAMMQYATTTASPVPDGTYSYSQWYYLDVDATSFGPDRQFSTVNSTNEASEPSLFFNIDGDDGAEPGNDDDILVSRVLTDGPGLGQSWLIRPLPRPTNHKQWVNYIATVQYDAGTNMTTIEGFYNGESMGFNGYGGSQQITTGKPEASTHMVFGADRGLLARFWNGYIDDVAIYDHVLTLEEIAALQLGPAVSSTPATTGDYNNNGTVDAADYALWRNGGPLQNDPTAGVQPADYDVWKAQFGKPPGSGASLAAVPEPAAISLALLAISLGLIRLRIKA